MVEKVIKNGKVAVLFSSGFGAGWVTWNLGNVSKERIQEILFHPKLVELVNKRNTTEKVKQALFEIGWSDRFKNRICTRRRSILYS